MKKTVALLATALAMSLAAAPAIAQATGDQYDDEPSGISIRGSITDVSLSAKVIIVEEDPSSASGSAKGEFAVDAGTEILRQQGNTRVPATFGELEAGQVVEATYAGPVAESYPTRGIAGRIVILEDGSEPAPPATPSASATPPGSGMDMLPDTGGAFIPALLAGASLLCGGLLVRRLVR